MADEAKEETQENSSLTMYYVVGAVIVLAIAAGIYFLRSPQTAPSPSAPVAQQTTPIPRPTGPITKLACEAQYYNPVIGFPKYFLTAEGSDLPEASKVTCAFSATVGDKEVASESVTSDLVDATARNGKTFRCTTSALTLQKTVPTKINVKLTDDKNASSTCSANFSFP